MCYGVLTKPLELMELYLPKHSDRFRRSNLPGATEIEGATSLLSMCLFVLARELSTIGNPKAITLANISSALPVGLKGGLQGSAGPHSWAWARTPARYRWV